MKNLFSELYFNHCIKDIDYSLNILLHNLRSLAPQSKENPFVVLLTPGIYNFTYDQNATNVHKTLAETLQLKHGVCQDYAHLMIGICGDL